MAHLDLHEQEQVEKIKYFWRDWGKYFVVLVVLLAIGYAGSSAYSWHKASQSQKAVSVYQVFVTDLSAKNNSGAFTQADSLIATYPATEYASMAAISAGKLAFDNKDYAKAEHYLNWVKDNSSDKSLKSIAVLRLASVYVDEGKFDQARELLRTKHDIAFDGLFYEAKGDVYVAMGDLDKARDSYKEGLQKAANDPTTQQAIQMKMQVIGN
jgi:predicted negative regulator of RcsB-dependent stress response